MADIDGFTDTLTGLAYCPATKTLWMSSNSTSPLVYDPRSATDITPFLQQNDASSVQTKEAKERIQRLFRINETGELLASTSNRNLVIWRFNPHGACSILRAHTDWVEVLAHCYKEKQVVHDGVTDGEEARQPPRPACGSSLPYSDRALKRTISSRPARLSSSSRIHPSKPLFFSLILSKLLPLFFANFLLSAGQPATSPSFR